MAIETQRQTFVSSILTCDSQELKTLAVQTSCFLIDALVCEAQIDHRDTVLVRALSEITILWNSVKSFFQGDSVCQECINSLAIAVSGLVMLDKTDESIQQVKKPTFFSSYIFFV